MAETPEVVEQPSLNFFKDRAARPPTPIDDYLRDLPSRALTPEKVEKEKLLFLPKPIPSVAPSMAANRAHVDSLVENDPTSFQRRNAEHLLGSVETMTTQRMERLIEEQGVLNTGVLTPEFMVGKTPQEKLAIIENQLNNINLVDSRVLPRDLAAIEFYMAGGGQMSMAAFENFYAKTDVSQLWARAKSRMAIGNQQAHYVLDDIAASHGMGNAAEALTALVGQEMTPILGVGTRIEFERRMARAVTGKIPKGFFAGWFLGELRQYSREALFKMAPPARRAAYGRMKAEIKRLEGDPISAAWLTNYNVLETVEALDTEGLRTSTTPDDRIDRWMGNFETVIEALGPVWVATRLAKKGVRAAFDAGDKVSAVQMSTAAGRADEAGRLLDELQDDALATTFALESDELVTPMLPRPITFVDDLHEVPEGSKNMIIRNERTRSEIMESTAKPELGLSPRTKANIVHKEIEKLDLADGAAVQPRMSTLQKFEDDSGFRMRVTVGESANGGFKDIDDAILDAIDIDADLRKVNIHRIGPNGTLEPVFDSPEAFKKAITEDVVDPATAGRIAGGDTLDESFYLVYDRDYLYSSIDKELGGTTFLSGVMGSLRSWLTPNAKFGDEIYGAFTRSYMQEQKLNANLEGMFKPYYDLNRNDKRFVASAYEWMEEFGKNKSRAPNLTETRAQFEGMSQSQMDGLIALRQGYDTMHDLFNRKLYRNWRALGFETARPLDGTLPTFHGKRLDRADAAGEMVLDPATQKMVKMTRREVDDLYDSGGSILHTDVAVDAAEDVGHKATKILMRNDTYKVGDLSTRPLVHHPGYSMRFYDDPYYVVKVTDGIMVNGSVKVGSSVLEEAVKTAGSVYQAERAARILGRADKAAGLNTTYKVVRSNNVAQTESSLFQKQAIHREGRLFWDERNYERLPDVNGNRAKLEDPVKALERGIGLASRQLTGEDLTKGVKLAWKNEFGHMLTNDELRVFDMKTISDKLGKMRKNTVDKEQAESIRKAKELLDYMRMVDGVDQTIIPAFRHQVIQVGEFLNRNTGGFLGKRIAKKGQTIDPIQFAKSVAYHMYIVARPIRQLFLQSSQIGYLSGLAPKYIGTGQVFKDGMMLRRGLYKLRKSGYDDGLTDKIAAKAMGLSAKEYRKVIKEFDRSALTDLVSVHSHIGGANKFSKTEMGSEGILGAVGYKARSSARFLQDKLSKGFEMGEGYNISFTYGTALNRMMDRKGYKSLLELTSKNWDDLKLEASNMALAMIKTNNAPWQTGAWSLPTQFLSFQHKVALGMLGQNPAIKGEALVRLHVGNTLLYGAGMYGIADHVKKTFTENNIEDEQIPGTGGVLLSDLMANGLIETTFNHLGSQIDENWQPLDLSGFTPGLDPERYATSFIELATEGDFGFVLGPTASTGSAILKSINFGSKMWQAGESDVHPADKFLAVSDYALRKNLPFYNDVAMAYVGQKLMKWENEAGEPTELTATTASLLARGLFGVRSKEELAYYNMNNDVWNKKQEVRNIQRADANFLAQQVGYFHDGIIDEDALLGALSSIMYLKEDWPDGAKRDLYKGILNTVISGRKAQQTLGREIYDAFKANGLSGDEAVAMVDRLNNKTPEEKTLLKKMFREAYADKLTADQQTFEDIGEQVDGRTR